MNITRKKILTALLRRMTDEEKKLWRSVASTLAEHQVDTLPKQESILDYVRARQELDILRPGLVQAMNTASELAGQDQDSLEAKQAVNNMLDWQKLVVAVENKIKNLRTSIGMDAKYETQLNKAKKVKGSAKGGPEIKPWE